MNITLFGTAAAPPAVGPLRHDCSFESRVSEACSFHRHSISPLIAICNFIFYPLFNSLDLQHTLQFL